MGAGGRRSGEGAARRLDELHARLAGRRCPSGFRSPAPPDVRANRDVSRRRRGSVDPATGPRLSAIAGRGAAKDFWDLDELLARGVAGGT